MPCYHHYESMLGIFHETKRTGSICLFRGDFWDSTECGFEFSEKEKEERLVLKDGHILGDANSLFAVQHLHWA